MKVKYLTLTLGLLLCGNIFSQDVISGLKKFYEEADMKCYLDRIEKNVKDCYKAQCEYWKVDESVNPPKVNFKKDKMVPMLAIQFVDMENYDYSENIYNHITLDSTRVFTLAYVDDEMNVFAFANYYDGEYAYTEVKSERPSDREKLEQVIKNINKHDPEIILFCSSLKGFRDLNSFMYIKGDSIYVYHVNKDDVYELNDYVRQFLTVEKIHSLNNTPIPFAYQFFNKDKPNRRTGNAPEKLKMMCEKTSK